MLASCTRQEYVMRFLRAATEVCRCLNDASGCLLSQAMSLGVSQHQHQVQESLSDRRRCRNRPDHLTFTAVTLARGSLVLSFPAAALLLPLFGTKVSDAANGRCLM